MALVCNVCSRSHRRADKLEISSAGGRPWPGCQSRFFETICRSGRRFAARCISFVGGDEWSAGLTGCLSNTIYVVLVYDEIWSQLIQTSLQTRDLVFLWLTMWLHEFWTRSFVDNSTPVWVQLAACCRVDVAWTEYTSWKTPEQVVSDRKLYLSDVIKYRIIEKREVLRLLSVTGKKTTLQDHNHYQTDEQFAATLKRQYMVTYKNVRTLQVCH